MKNIWKGADMKNDKPDYYGPHPGHMKNKRKKGKSSHEKALRAKEAIYGTGTNKKVEGGGHLGYK